MIVRFFERLVLAPKFDRLGQGRCVARCTSVVTLPTLVEIVDALRPLKDFPIRPLSPAWVPNWEYCEASVTPAADTGYTWLYFPLATPWAMLGSPCQNHTFPMPVAKCEASRDGYYHLWPLSVVFKLLPIKRIASSFFSSYGSAFWYAATDLSVPRSHMISSLRSRKATKRGPSPALLTSQQTWSHNFVARNAHLSLGF